jgi:hypothetical protein
MTLREEFTGRAKFPAHTGCTTGTPKAILRGRLGMHTTAAEISENRYCFGTRLHHNGWMQESLALHRQRIECWRRHQFDAAIAREVEDDIALSISGLNRDKRC